MQAVVILFLENKILRGFNLYICLMRLILSVSEDKPIYIYIHVLSNINLMKALCTMGNVQVAACESHPSINISLIVHRSAVITAYLSAR